MFEIIKPDINIDFIGFAKWAIAVSIALMLASVLSLVVKGGPNYGIDFTGGLLVHIRVDPSVHIDEIRDAVKSPNLADVQVQAFESQKGEYLLRVSVADEAMGGGEAAQIKQRLGEAFGSRGFEALRTEIVGPRVGRDLRTRAILSVLFATVAMGVYIALRFDLRFGVGAAFALFHDVVVALGALSVADYEVDLTIVGYSVNDTVIVSDRIRENMHGTRRYDLAAIINRSINETLSRTILTSGTVLLVLVALFMFGGSVIRGFAFALIVGVIAGTYSSIFVASPIVEWWARRAGQAA